MLGCKLLAVGVNTQTRLPQFHTHRLLMMLDVIEGIHTVIHTYNAGLMRDLRISRAAQRVRCACVWETKFPGGSEQKDSPDFTDGIGNKANEFSSCVGSLISD